MDNLDLLKGMLKKVADAMGPEMLTEVAFLGGCSTGLHITDEATKSDVRMTHDVDLVVSVVGYSGWIQLQDKLRQRGFKESMDVSYTCSMKLDELQVDFLPDDEQALGFSCQWFKSGLHQAVEYKLDAETSIKLLSPPYFIASKIEAYKNRGNNDMLSSKDIGDILTVIDGREELIEEINQAQTSLKVFLAESFLEFLQDNYFDYALQDSSNGDQAREDLIRERIDFIIQAGS